MDFGFRIVDCGFWIERNTFTLEPESFESKIQNLKFKEAWLHITVLIMSLGKPKVRFQIAPALGTENDSFTFEHVLLQIHGHRHLSG